MNIFSLVLLLFDIPSLSPSSVSSHFVLDLFFLPHVLTLTYFPPTLTDCTKKGFWVDLEKDKKKKKKQKEKKP